jgi:hypothetical protein
MLNSRRSLDTVRFFNFPASINSIRSSDGTARAAPEDDFLFGAGAFKASRSISTPSTIAFRMLARISAGEDWNPEPFFAAGFRALLDVDSGERVLPVLSSDAWGASFDFATSFVAVCDISVVVFDNAISDDVADKLVDGDVSDDVCGGAGDDTFSTGPETEDAESSLSSSFSETTRSVGDVGDERPDTCTVFNAEDEREGAGTSFSAAAGSDVPLERLSCASFALTEAFEGVWGKGTDCVTNVDALDVDEARLDSPGLWVLSFLPAFTACSASAGRDSVEDGDEEE